MSVACRSSDARARPITQHDKSITQHDKKHPGGHDSIRAAVTAWLPLPAGPFRVTAILGGVDRRIYSYVSAHRTEARYPVAAQSWSQASPYILATGQEVLPMAGSAAWCPSRRWPVCSSLSAAGSSGSSSWAGASPWPPRGSSSNVRRSPAGGGVMPSPSARLGSCGRPAGHRQDKHVRPGLG